MSVRTAIAVCGLAVMLGGCMKPKPKVEVPRPEPRVVYKKPKPQVQVKYFAHGYEIRYRHEGVKAVYTFRKDSDGIEACVDLNSEGKDWVRVCSKYADRKVTSMNNYTRLHECKFDKKKKVKKKNKKKKKGELCGDKVEEDSQNTFNYWFNLLNVDNVHKVWLYKRKNPLEHWKR